MSFSLQGLWNEKMIPLVLVHLHLSGILIKTIPWSKFIEKKYAKQGIRGALGACVFQTWTTFPLEAIDKCLETIYDKIVVVIHSFKIIPNNKLGLFGMLKLALALQFIVTNAYFSVARTLTLVLHATLK